MTLVSCSVPERFVNPLFEVFDGGDFILSSFRDVEEPLTSMRIYLPDASKVDDAKARLSAALAIVGAEATLETGEIADEDWKLSYRRHFKVEAVGARLLLVPAWEKDTVSDAQAKGRQKIVLDPGLAFGTGRHETTRACLEYIDELSLLPDRTGFLDMGCGSGILSIAASLLGFEGVRAFDVDEEAVRATRENAAENGVSFPCARFALGRKAALPDALAVGGFCSYDLVVANILGPLLIRFADEVAAPAKKRLILSGILSELYPDVRAAYEKLGFSEVSSKTKGEWTTGLFTRTNKE